MEILRRCTVMQNAARVPSWKSRKWPFLAKKRPFLPIKMTLALEKSKVLKSPLVRSFYEPRRAFWHMFRSLGVAAFCGFFVSRCRNSTIFIGGTLSKKFFFGKNRKFSIFLFPRNGSNTIAITLYGMLIPYFARINHILKNSGQNT